MRVSAPDWPHSDHSHCFVVFGVISVAFSWLIDWAVIPAQEACLWLPGVPCRHQSSEKMCISSQYQVLSCHFRGKTVVLGCVPHFGQLGRFLRYHVNPLGGTAPCDFEHSSLSHLPPSCLCHLATLPCLWLYVHHSHSSWLSSSSPRSHLESMCCFSFWLFPTGTRKDGKACCS